jgi:hypothetical protein
MRAFLENVEDRQIPLPTRRRQGLFKPCHPFHPSGGGTPGAPDREGRVSGPPVHRGAHHQRPSGARVLRLRPTCRPVRDPDSEDTWSFHGDVLNAVFAPGGRFERQLTPKISCSSKTNPPPTQAVHCRDLPPITTARIDVRQRPRRAGNSHRGQGFRSACPRRRTTRTPSSMWLRRARAFVPAAGLFGFDPRLTPLDADPPSSFFLTKSGLSGAQVRLRSSISACGTDRLCRLPVNTSVVGG